MSALENDLIPYGMALGGDGKVWIVENAVDQIARIDPATGIVLVVTTDATVTLTHTGTVNLDDWGPAATQLNSMMRMSYVPEGERMTLLSKAYLAKTEAEKQVIIEQIEQQGLEAGKEFANLLGLTDVESNLARQRAERA